jgi:hypothetical protein
MRARARIGRKTQGRTIAARPIVDDDAPMPPEEPDDRAQVEPGAADPVDEPGSAGADEPKGRRNPWVWISALLAVIAAGSLIWALATESDNDSTQDQLASTQQELASTQEQLDGTQEELDSAGAVRRGERAAQRHHRRVQAGARRDVSARRRRRPANAGLSLSRGDS